MNALRSFLDQFRLLNRPARLFLLALMCDGLFFAGWNLFFNLYIISAGFSREFLGLINALPSVSALIFGVPMGLLADRLGGRRSMVIGFIVANTFIIIMGAVRQPALMLVMAFLWGIGGQLYVLSQAPFMMRVSDDRTRDLLFSVSFGLFPLANTLGNALAGQLPGLLSRLFDLPAGSAPSYQAVLLCAAFSSFVVLIPLSLIHEPARRPPEEQAHSTMARQRPVWKVLTRPLTLQLALPNLLTGIGAAMVIPYLNIFFREQHHLSDGQLGLLFSAGALSIGIATLVAPRLVGNLGGKVRLVVLAQSISVVFLLVLGFSPWPWLAVIGFLVRGTLMNMAAPLFDAFAMEQTSEAEQGAVNSVRGLAWNFGWAVGPLISGVVQASYGFAPLFAATSVLYVCANIVTWTFFRHPRLAAG